jgi:hypothetical protein
MSQPRPVDVSVVVQGAINALTPAVLASVREHFPGAELILSTWEGSDVAGLDTDVTPILNRDPGPIDSPTRPNANNVNRMVVSTQAGLAKASRPIAVKLRTDTRLAGPDCLEAFARSTSLVRPRHYRVFTERVVVGQRFTRNPIRSAFTHHPSDIIQVGLTEDLRLLWSAKNADPSNSAPEQYVWLECLKEAGVPVGADPPALTWRNIFRSEAALMANFVVADLGVQLPEKLLRRDLPHDWTRTEDCYSPAESVALSWIYSWRAGRLMVAAALAASAAGGSISPRLRRVAYTLLHPDGGLWRRVLQERH